MLHVYISIVTVQSHCDVEATLMTKSSHYQLICATIRTVLRALCLCFCVIYVCASQKSGYLINY